LLPQLPHPLPQLPLQQKARLSASVWWMSSSFNPADFKRASTELSRSVVG
jgi:hypothetical protein